MAEQISKDLIRQIEIISMVLENPGYYNEYDIGEYFNESITTVRRDFSKIRRMGIAIHSSKKYLHISQKLDLNILNKLINTYNALSETDSIKNLNEITKIFKDKTLSIFIKIVKSINDKTIINFEYETDAHNQPIRRMMVPISLYKTNRSFLIAGLENDDKSRIKFYLVEKIRNIKFTSKKSSHRQLPSMRELLEYSWGYFTSGKPEKIVLQFDKKCSYLKDRIFVNNQWFEELDDYIEFKAELKISNEFISWLMGWGKLVRVVSPLTLKKELIKRSKEIIENYK